jgi:glutamate/aspartate transport system permease protein
MGNLDFSAIVPSLGYLFGQGMVVTLIITVVSSVLGIALGTMLAIMRMSPKIWLSAPATLYINTLRSIPLLLVIFAVYFMLPIVGAWVVGSPYPLQIGALRAALVSFTLFEAAYFAEIIRSGIQSIRAGQVQAGQAIGLSQTQVMRYVILPQAVRNMIPPLLMRVIIIFQDTALVYVVSLTDFLGAASNVGINQGRLTEMYIFVAATYFIICFVVSKIVNRIDANLRVIR